LTHNHQQYAFSDKWQLLIECHLKYWVRKAAASCSYIKNVMSKNVIWQNISSSSSPSYTVQNKQDHRVQYYN